jgi:hypothetical protein
MSFRSQTVRKRERRLFVEPLVAQPLAKYFIKIHAEIMFTSSQFRRVFQKYLYNGIPTVTM